MSVYVDVLTTCLRNKNWPYGQACHLIADTIDELHLFATKKLRLKRRWFQDNTIPHYDLTKNMRAKAVKERAVEIDRQEFVKRIRKYAC